MNLRKFIIGSGMLALLQTMGCMSFSTFQTVEPNAKGEFTMGGGVIMLGEAFVPEFSCRMGLVDNLDVGLKYSLPYLLVADAKYQYFKGEITSSIDFGWSYFSENKVTMNGYYPMLLFGKENWYGGVKGNFFDIKGSLDLFDDEPTFSGSGYLGTSLIIGKVSPLKSAKLLFELNILLVESQNAMFLPGIGISF